MVKLFLLLFVCINLYAHQLRENYLYVDYNATTRVIEIKIEIETRLFESANIDDNKNGIVSHKELRAHQKSIFGYVQKHFRFFCNNEYLPLDDAKITFHRYSDQTYMQIDKIFKNIDLDALELRYDIFFELEDTHKLIIHLTNNKDAIVDKNNRFYRFSSSHMGVYERLCLFVKEGIFHIWDGFDHLLFVLMLLIPSVLQGKNDIKVSIFSLIKIVSVFSLAHSITLFIAGFGIWTPNTVFIESAIALSILIVAVLNFFQSYSHIDFKIVFFFGLFHGFGFANVLEIAQVKDTFSFVVALFGFNIGVELGQIVVIALVTPLLYLLMRLKYYGVIFKSICAVSILVSSIWFLQRIALV